MTKERLAEIAKLAHSGTEPLHEALNDLLAERGMTIQDYQDNTVKTESKDYEAMRGRLNLDGMPQDLERQLDFFAQQAHVLDVYKKALFYGKPMDFSKPARILRRVKPDLNRPEIIRILHSILGMASEVGELIEAFCNHVFYGYDLDVVNLVEETGDLGWYIGLMGDTLAAMEGGVGLPVILERNIEKLRKRYPHKFNEHDALNRNLEEERKILDGTAQQGEEAGS